MAVRISVAVHEATLHSTARDDACRFAAGRKPAMPAASRRAVTTVRIDPEHLNELRRLADTNATTISRLIARAVAQSLDTGNAKPTDPDAAR